jgi:predicted adenylyl cyclase CyaB
MKLNNYEFKARVEDLQSLERKLQELKPVFKGEDHQVDIYFKVNSGRLKLREGDIENALIYYERPDTSGARQSDILLYRHNQEDSLKEILTKVFGILAVVDKRRRIYYLENVKFHFDSVQELGYFIEVEALNEGGGVPLDKLIGQCQYYTSFFGFSETDYVGKSYSDLIIEKHRGIG